MNSLEYLLLANSISRQLSELLATDFSHHRFEDLPHAKRANELVASWFLDDRQSALRNLDLLKYFAKHLKEVRDSNPDVLQAFRREFRRARTDSQFIGLRFEAYVAASLSRKNISFIKAESPDFRLDEIGCNIECTSTSISNDGDSRDLSYKVVSAIRKKAATESNRRDCALFIDITNLLHLSLQATSDNIRNDTLSALQDTHFFAVILFAHMFNSDRKRLETIYFREDNLVLSDTQHAFLEEHYPIIGDQVLNFWFPKSG